MIIERNKLSIFYGISFLYLILSAFCLYNEFYWIAALPVLILIGTLTIVSIDSLMMLIVFFTPLAINLSDENSGSGMSIPTEPLLFGLMVIFFIKLFHEGGFDKKILKHPITILIIINLGWMAITSLTSTMPLVSLKYFISRLWFVVVFYFLGTQLFKNYPDIKKFIWMYVIPLLGVIGYTTYRHISFGLTEKSAHWVMSPFYNDHTAYAAAIAMFVPIMTAMLFHKKYSARFKFVVLIVNLILLSAIILSYTRAAWIGLVIALLVYVLFLFKIKGSIVFTTAFVCISGYFIFQKEITMKLEKNRQDSSSDYKAHIQSMSNISTDASNLERINRWKSAFRMFYKKPFLGWGPGTYSFKYAPFQHAKDMTIISTNSGNKGNAHSEYIGPLAESGVLGSLSFIAIAIMSIFTASRLYIKLKNAEMRMIVMGILLGLITYYVHGMLNNFLDTDKASVPFWGFIAILVTIDIYHHQADLEKHKPTA